MSSVSQSPTFEALRDSFRGDLVLPEDQDYAEALKRWSTLAERPAGIVAFVKDEKDVATALVFAIDSKLEIAVKGGGHNPSGASSTDGGLVIDLSRYMNAVKVDPDARIAHVGGGALWADVDNATAPFGLGAVGGTVNHTGVGGLTVGGGYGWLTGRHGMVVDNVVGATVVTAAGDIIRATEDENPDLFFGIRGGGVNFGVVTTFELALHPIPPICWGGPLIFTPDKLEAVFTAADEWFANATRTDDMGLLVITRSPQDETKVVILFLAIYLGPQAEAKKAFKLLYDVGPVADMTSEMPYAKTNSLLNPIAPHGLAYYMAAATIAKPTIPVAKEILQAYTSLYSEYPENPVVGAIVYEFFSTVKAQDIPNSAMAFSCRGPHANVLVSLHWHPQPGRDKEEAEIRRKGREMVKMIEGSQINPETPYGNYESDKLVGDAKVKKLFGSNYSKLQQIKAKYDPNLVFNKWFPIEPARI